MTVTIEDTGEHGIREALYAGGPGEPYYQPTLMCLCGWSTQRQQSWEDAGRELDDHLRETEPSETPKSRVMPGATKDHCPHPARKGSHELYTMQGGRGFFCRACGWTDPDESSEEGEG